MESVTPSRKISEKRDSSEAASPQFCEVLVSPGRSPLKGNLTGVARKVKDSCADWHNYSAKWQALNTKGTATVSEIANVKLESIFSSEVKEEVAEYLPEELHRLVAKLQIIYEEMKRIVEKFESITRALKGVSELEWYQQNESFCEEPLFQTWSTNMFYETSEKLLGMYQKELEVKETILHNIAHATSRDLIMTYSACWLHQPYIEDTTKDLLLNSLLKETGLT